MEIKSKPIKTKMLYSIMWSIVAISLILQIFLAIFDYSSYKKGQEYALTVHLTSQGESLPSDKTAYEEACSRAYNLYSGRAVNLYWNNESIRKQQNALQESFAKIMNEEGYYRYSSFNIASWFSYTNFISFCQGNFTFPFALCLLLIATILTIIISIEKQKEIIVDGDSLFCRCSKKKSLNFMVEDIVSIKASKIGLSLRGKSFKFKIFFISNIDELKNVITDKLSVVKRDDENTVILNSSEADELKKFKELFDSGVITQEEFDAKKKQILGL